MDRRRVRFSRLVRVHVLDDCEFVTKIDIVRGCTLPYVDIVSDVEYSRFPAYWNLYWVWNIDSRSRGEMQKWQTLMMMMMMARSHRIRHHRYRRGLHRLCEHYAICEGQADCERRCESCRRRRRRSGQSVSAQPVFASGHFCTELYWRLWTQAAASMSTSLYFLVT